MPSYPHVLTEEQMLDVLELAEIKYDIVHKAHTVENEIQIRAKDVVFIKIISEFEPVVPQLFELFLQLKSENKI